jgi:monovalent cation:H+ antiporter-2, CPA2 family
MDSTTHDLSRVLIELGLVVIGLAILARIASRWAFSAIPLYLLAGLAFGNGGLAPLNVSEGFMHIGADIGVLLLLFMLGLEYTGGELVENLRGGFPAAVVDLALNFTPGLIAGLLEKFERYAPVMVLSRPHAKCTVCECVLGSKPRRRLRGTDSVQSKVGRFGTS